jgi:hypothetical protein
LGSAEDRIASAVDKTLSLGPLNKLMPITEVASESGNFQPVVLFINEET